MSGFSHPNSLFNARNPYLLTLSAIFKLYFFFLRKKNKAQMAKEGGISFEKGKYFLLNLLLNNLLPERTY